MSNIESLNQSFSSSSQSNDTNMAQSSNDNAWKHLTWTSQGGTRYVHAAENVIEPSEYVFSTFEMPFLRATHLFTRSPCCNLAIHHQPVKPDRQVAYQASCQLGCLIALSKHPPAFCLLPPTPKPPEAGAYQPPPVCNSSAIHAACTFPQYSTQYSHDLTFLLQATFSSIFSHLAGIFFFCKWQMALEMSHIPGPSRN